MIVLRALWFLALVTIISFLLGWLADNPGRMLLDWQGYRVETSVAVLVAAVMFLSIFFTIVYQLWSFVRRAPQKVLEIMRSRKRVRGYKAFTQGMVAVAAGDSTEAIRQGKRANILLEELPLTMLLSAQAAQLNGNEKAAKSFFSAMTKKSETKFLGLRGLINQAMKENNIEEALDLTRKAYALKPKSDWVAQNLFELQIKQGRWQEALDTNDSLTQNGLVEKKVSQKRKAILAYQLGLSDIEGGQMVRAQTRFQQSINFDPNFVPSVLVLVEYLLEQGNLSKARNIIEKAWKTKPHPDLLELYLRSVEAKKPMDRMKAAENLANYNPQHSESVIAKIESALRAKLWGEARKYLEVITGENFEKLNSRLCRLWAELEKAENEDVERVHMWLTRASKASVAETWVCYSCGNTVNKWVAVCQNCELFNSLSWKCPPNVMEQLGVSEGTLGEEKKVTQATPKKRNSTFL